MRYQVKAIRGASEVAVLPVEALNEAEASDFVRRQGYDVVSISRNSGLRFNQQATTRPFPVIKFSQELIALLKAGLTLVEAIEILHRKEEQAGNRDLLNELLTKLRQGLRFSAVLESSQEFLAGKRARCRARFLFLAAPDPVRREPERLHKRPALRYNVAVCDGDGVPPITAARLMTPAGRLRVGGTVSLPALAPSKKRAKGRSMINLQFILAVAAGGAIGSVARFLVGVGFTRWFGIAFPWGTLAINIAGSFLIGVFAEAFALRWNLSETARIFLTVGICGGFTTFSTFSLDSYVLLQRGELWLAGAYICGSVLLSVGALIAGLHWVRAW